ncbi:MAG TPA: VWA domain-containing protein [Pseudomonadales bacterium]
MFDALGDLHFIRPLWLLALVPAALLAWYWARRRAADSHWESAIEPALLDVLLEPGARRRSRHVPWLAALGLSLAALGLAGPTWERLPQPVERKTDALIILFDLSLSMFAEDVPPSRLVRARQKIADVLRRRDEGFTALVAYAGDAHAVVPLTDDTRTIENLLPALRPDMMPVLGSDLGDALDVARLLFENANVRQGRILVVTDGVEDVSAATERRSERFPISILGIGTESGGQIPLDFVNQPGQVLRTQQGEPIVARLDSARLEQIADLTYGRYHPLTLSDDDIEHLLGTALPGADDTTEVEREFDTWVDMGYWVLLLIVPLALLGFRRGALAVLPILLVPLPADAGIWDDLWQRRDQQAYQALREGEPETAAALFDSEDWRAAALYRSGEYAAAAASYRRQPSITALYNLGNSLALQQDFKGAIAAYERVLERDPDHTDARFNKELLENLQRQQEQQQNATNEQQRGDSPDGESEGQPDRGDPGNPEQNPGQNPSGEPPPEQNETPESARAAQQGDGRGDEQQSVSRDERRDALEQWLRRVPDDPGGLLRRKFQYETNLRLRRGDYRSQETDQIW